MKGGGTFMSEMQETRLFEVMTEPVRAAQILKEVHRVLQEKGYDPVNQIVGYLLSGDPTYITREVRGLLRSIERDELIEELVRAYLGEF